MTQNGSFLGSYAANDGQQRSDSPGLRVKKSMPNMSVLNGPTVSRDPHRLLNKRSSGNLRDYPGFANQQSRRPFASHTGATGSDTFNSLFGNALGNGTFEPSNASPTSPSDPLLSSQGANLPGVPGGFVRQPLGPTSESKGFGQRSSHLRPQSLIAPISNSSTNLAAIGNNGVIGGQRTSSAGKSDNHSVHTNGSSIMEDDEAASSNKQQDRDATSPSTSA